MTASGPRQMVELADFKAMPSGGDNGNGADSFTTNPMMRREESIVPTTANPFENIADWTCYEILKAIVLAPTLFPCRLIVLVVCATFAFVLAWLSTCGIRLSEDRGCYMCLQPLRGWRRALLRPVWLLNRGVLWSFGFWSVNILDRRKDRRQTPNLLVVAPHITLVDQFVLASAFPPLPCGVGDVSIIRLPCMGVLAVASQGIFVDLEKKSSRESCREAIAARADPNKWTGPATMIFPEGRVTNGRMLIQFKLGAFSPGQAVLPVLLRYPFRFFDPAWVGKNRSPLWPLRMMLQFANYCQVEVLDAYEPDEEERQDAELFARRVRCLMADALCLGTTEHTYDDAWLYQTSLRARRKVENDFEVQAMRALFEVDLDALKRWLRAFHQMDRDKDGNISRTEFVKIMQADPSLQGQTSPRQTSSDSLTSPLKRHCASMDRLFRFFDTDGSGSISYREFVQAVALMSGKCSAASRAKLAFLIFDVDGRGKISRALLSEAVDNAFAVDKSRARRPLAEAQPPSQNTERAQSMPLRQVSPKTAEPREAKTCAGDYFASATVGQLLLQDSEGSPHDSDEIGYKEFCSIVDANPSLLDAAFDAMRQRFRCDLSGV